ncbi:B3 domain-containing protein [Apostasia shenzhenica]|uniref:B3 domain-containing protein n=1 Tax=Apostasia shenzhenica TaxID=1088818 RepID=A0A2I0AZI2_9ASPA|nr:B3 domain-containing protein [Apostasia shenzhenica]
MGEECKHCKKWKEQCQRFEEHFYWDHVDATRMHFSKLMFGDFSNSMVIPKKFMDYFSGELLEAVELKVPSGNIWHVSLRKTNDGAALECGWRKFIEDHDIQENDTLVFKYDGNSSFFVLMFDQGGCEKAAAHCPKRWNPVFNFCESPPGKSSQRRANGFPRYTSQELLPSFDDEMLKARKSSQDKHVRLGSKFRKISSNKKQLVPSNDEETLNGLDSMTTEGTESPSTEVCLDNQSNFKDVIMSKRLHLTAEEKSKVLSFVETIQTDKPYFVSFMVRTSILKRFYMSIPMKFAEEYLPQTSQLALLLLPEKTRSWSVQLLVQKQSVGFSCGWKEFVKDNNLKVGNVCLFELLGIQDGVTVIVHINRSYPTELVPKQ